MTTYAGRYAAAMAPLLPDDVEVIEASGLIVIQRGEANIAVWPPSAYDKRAAVSFEQARELIRHAAERLAGEIPKYRESFRPPARELVEVLRTVSASPDTLAAVEAPKYGPGTPEYAAYQAALTEELEKFARGESPYALERVREHLDEDEATTGATPVVVQAPTVPNKAAAAERLASAVGDLLSVLDRKHQHHDEVSAALALYRGAPQ